MEIELCNKCKNYFGDLQCMAFPERIPDEILLSENNHSEPLKDQENDIVFEPIVEEDFPKEVPADQPE